MKKLSRKILYTIVIIYCSSCYNIPSKESHVNTTELKKGLYVETYTVYASGAFGTDRVAEYLTDSMGFKKYIGEFDEGNEYYYYKPVNDTVWIYKYKSQPKELINQQFIIIPKR